MPKIGKYSSYLIAALLLSSVSGWASYQPITGSTVTVNNLMIGGSPISASNQMPITGSISNTGFNATQSGAWTVSPGTGTYPVQIQSGSISNTGFNVNNTPTVLISSQGVNASTVAVAQIGQWSISPGTGTYPISGSINNTGFNSTQSGSWSVSPGTGTYPVQIQSGSISNTGFNVNNTPTVLISSQGVNASTIAVAQIGQWSVSPGTGTYPVQIQAGSISNTGFNVNNSPTVLLTGFPLTPTGVNASTVAVINGQSTKLLVTPDSVALPANQSINLNQVNGSAVTTSGTAGQMKVSVQVAGDSNTVTATGNLSDNGAAASTNRVGDLIGIYKQNSQASAATDGRDAALVVGTADHSVRFTPSPDISRYSFSGSTVPFTLATNPTYIAGICGNATTTTLVRGLRLTGTQTTAGQVNISVKKLSAKFAGAWSTMTATNEDSNYTAANSTAAYFTANPTGAAEVGHLDDETIGFMASATASPNDVYVSPSQWDTKPIVLRGAAQCVVVDLLGQAVTGSKASVLWRWTEDSSL